MEQQTFFIIAFSVGMLFLIIAALIEFAFVAAAKAHRRKFARSEQRKRFETRRLRSVGGARAMLSEDSQGSFQSIRRDLALDAREMRANGESKVAIRSKIRRQTMIAYLAFATAPIARVLRAPFRWRRG